MTNPLLSLENIRSGAFPSDAHAVGFLLGEIERLERDNTQLCGNLSLAEEGLANATQEIERLRSLLAAACERNGGVCAYGNGNEADRDPCTSENCSTARAAHEPDVQCPDTPLGRALSWDNPQTDVVNDALRKIGSETEPEECLCGHSRGVHRNTDDQCSICGGACIRYRPSQKSSEPLPLDLKPGTIEWVSAPEYREPRATSSADTPDVQQNSSGGSHCPHPVKFGEPCPVCSPR